MTLPLQAPPALSGPWDDRAWIAHHTPKPRARLRLFCLPHAAGSASLFRGWAPELGPEIELCPLQLPGREGRLQEPPFTQLGPLVQALADVVGRRLDIPYALFGHSMGALVAFELAREMRRRGLPGPTHLFVASYVAPHRLGRPESRSGESEGNRIKQAIEGLTLPAGVAEEFVRMMRATALADVAVCERYVYSPGAPLSCPLSAFRGFDDYVLEPQVVAWRELTTGPFSMRTFLGDHLFVREMPRGLLQNLRRTLTTPAAHPARGATEP